ncbi:hypothetical protein DOTSEDRAFT_55631 [Dothistroma septosporum NZE10]|uniref:Uncharacterized protein n=1 Tax=Dothistroma septosporum (strain NZE10 / CBS 128990) TaxID=675120 RepID=N1PCW2_DOTSN|nr:hypothetical protein DOTSEDRAFT_55631 [Dothistroma septosporum NZE10]
MQIAVTRRTTARTEMRSLTTTTGTVSAAMTRSPPMATSWMPTSSVKTTTRSTKTISVSMLMHRLTGLLQPCSDKTRHRHRHPLRALHVR